MSMSTHVVGFQPPDERWLQMKAIWDVCVSAKIPIPIEVSRFFGDGHPTDPGREIQLSAGVLKYLSDSRDGYEVDLSLLPKEVKILRFFNSW